MPYKPREIESLLQNKFGFSLSHGHSSDHRWYQLQLPGLPTILTKVSHNKRDIYGKIEGAMARQLRVRKQYFRGMMDCTNSQEEYYRQVREDPIPPFEFTSKLWML